MAFAVLAVRGLLLVLLGLVAGGCLILSLRCTCQTAAVQGKNKNRPSQDGNYRNFKMAFHRSALSVRFQDLENFSDLFLALLISPVF